MAYGENVQRNATPQPQEAVNCMLRDIKVYRLDDSNYDPAKMSALLRQSEMEGFDLLVRMDRNWRNGVNRFSRPGEALYCVEHEGRIVGVCGRAIDPNDPTILQLRHAYVLPEWRHLGIGSAVLKRLLDVPTGMFRKITLRAYFPLVRKFCERRGFMAVENQRHTHEMILDKQSHA